MSYVVRIVINAIALWAAVYFVPNISFPAAEHFPSNDWWKLVVVAAIFGLLNAFVKPIVKLLSLPIRLATLGLFTFVINAALFLLLAAVSDRFDLGLKIGDFPPTLTLTSLVAAFLGALVITVVSTILNIAIRD
ncbi:MAG TPA: phage holin family protein [Candidatus Limnocylindrales bacterium]|nr:phage holin family protein [Candidatus Limnocylindrales bacterium]